MGQNKMLVETIPAHMMSSFGTLMTTFVLIGFSTANVGGGLLIPDERDYEGHKKNETWRIIYGYPIFVSIFIVLLYIFIIKDRDSIIYNLS